MADPRYFHLRRTDGRRANFFARRPHRPWVARTERRAAILLLNDLADQQSEQRTYSLDELTLATAAGARAKPNCQSWDSAPSERSLAGLPKR